MDKRFLNVYNRSCDKLIVRNRYFVRMVRNQLKHDKLSAFLYKKKKLLITFFQLM